MARNTQNREHQNGDAPSSSKIAALPTDPGISFGLRTEMQRELFRTSGPQAPKRQRKKERKQAYMRWLDEEPRRQLERATEIATKRSERRMAKVRARAARAAKATIAAKAHSSQHAKKLSLAKPVIPTPFQILERQQWELFMSSGPRTTRKERKRERHGHSPKRRILIQGPSAPMPASTEDHGVPNRPEPQPQTNQKSSGGKPGDSIPTSFPDTTPGERSRHGRRARTGFRGWLKNLIGL